MIYIIYNIYNIYIIYKLYAYIIYIYITDIYYIHTYTYRSYSPNMIHSRFTDKNICVCVILFIVIAVTFLFVSHTLKYLIDIQLLRAGFQSQATSNLKRQLVHQ